MLYDPDDRMSCWNHSICGQCPLSGFKKLKHDVNGRGLLPTPQVNNNRNTFLVGPTNYFKPLGS